jgi:hypothetical protein
MPEKDANYSLNNLYYLNYGIENITKILKLII